MIHDEEVILGLYDEFVRERQTLDEVAAEEYFTNPPPTAEEFMVWVLCKGGRSREAAIRLLS